MAKNIIIADTQGAYVQRLTSYLQKHYGDAYEIEVIADKQLLKAHVEEKKCDVLLFSPEMYDGTLYLKNIKLPIILLPDDQQIQCSEKLKWQVNKYTRISKLITYIEQQYKEIEKNRPLVYAVYSPAGGVGKSTIAMATALAYAKVGKHVLYFNLEDVDSTRMYFSDVPTEAAHLSRIEVEDQDEAFLVRSIKKDKKSKILYMDKNLLAPQGALEARLATLIDKIVDKGMANIVVIDFSSSHTVFDEALMEVVDFILLVSNGESQCVYKLKQWMMATQIETFYKEKLKLVINRGKDLNVSTDLKVAAKIDKFYATNPLGLSEHIAEGQLLKLQGLV